MTTQVQLTGGAVLVGVGLLVGGLVLWRASRVAGAVTGEAWEGVKDGAATVGGWVNPTADTNLIYRGINAVGGAVAGEKDWSLGGAVYDWANPEPEPVTSGGGGSFQGTGATGSWSQGPQRGVTSSWEDEQIIVMP